MSVAKATEGLDFKVTQSASKSPGKVNKKDYSYQIPSVCIVDQRDGPFER